MRASLFSWEVCLSLVYLYNPDQITHESSLVCILWEEHVSGNKEIQIWIPTLPLVEHMTWLGRGGVEECSSRDLSFPSISCKWWTNDVKRVLLSLRRYGSSGALPNLISTWCLSTPSVPLVPCWGRCTWVAETESSVLGAHGPERSLEMARACPVVDSVCLSAEPRGLRGEHREPLPYKDLSGRCCVSLLSTVCLFLCPLEPRGHFERKLCRSWRRTDPGHLTFPLFTLPSKLPLRARNTQRKLRWVWKLRERPSWGNYCSTSPNNFPFFTHVQMEASSRK